MKISIHTRDVAVVTEKQPLGRNQKLFSGASRPSAK